MKTKCSLQEVKNCKDINLRKLLHVQNSYLVQEVLILEFLALLQWQEAKQINTLAHLTAGLALEKGANPHTFVIVCSSLKFLVGNGSSGNETLFLASSAKNVMVRPLTICNEAVFQIEEGQVGR